HAPFASLRLNNSGKTLPQNVSNLVNTSLYRPSTQQQFEDLATQLFQQVQFIQRDLRFTVDEHSGKTVIVVMDSQTDEVIREIPSEKLRQLAHNLRTLQEQLDGSTGHLSVLKGHLLDVRV
ncbi:MAG: flagellar protein FlaG, partial [Pseudomonadales bacterium]